MTTEKLKEYVLQCGEQPTLNLWSDMIDSAVKQAGKRKAVVIDYIPVSSEELKRIDILPGTQLRRFAFTLLCLSKYFDIVKPNNDHWICLDHKDIMKLANIKTSIKRQAVMMKQLEDSGYLLFPKKVDSISMKVLYQSPSDEDLLITNFKNLGYQYLKYKGEPYFECENCGTTVKINDPNAKKKQKYCIECAAKIKIEQTLARRKTIKSSN